MPRLSAILYLLLLTPLALGQAKVRVPATEDSSIDILVKVEAPSASYATVCDRLGLLAFAHEAKFADAQVSLHRLDAGKAGEPVRLKLPKPAGLAKYPTYATGLAFHPTLPLLYIWQDIEFPKDERKFPMPLSPADAAAAREFDHLLIYNVEKPTPELLVGLARAPEFVYSRPVGSVAIDAAGERLYVPNYLVPDVKTGESTVASYVLWADGMPLVGPVEEGKPAPGSEKPTPEARAAHVAAIQAASKANKQALPQRIAPRNGYAFFPDSGAGTGIGFVPVARDAVITGGYHATGIVSWTPEDRTCRMVHYRLNSSYTYKYPTGHPTLPLVYLTDSGTGHVYRFEHVDGNPTLVPQRADLEAANLTSFPVIMAKTKKIAVGGQARLFILKLNEQERFTGERQQTVIGNQYVRALAYSEKFDRLYVGVEKEKKK